MEGVDGHGGISACVGKPGPGEIADDEPRAAGQPEQLRPVRGLIDCDGREVHPHKRAIAFSGHPQPRRSPGDAPAAEKAWSKSAAVGADTSTAGEGSSWLCDTTGYSTTSSGSC